MTLVNPIHPDILPKVDPQFAEIYNKYLGPYIRADQVSIEEYRKNTPKYSFEVCPGPKPPTGSDTIYKIPVKNPDGEILVQVFTPTKVSIEKGNMMNEKGQLPAHVSYHGGGWVIGSLHSDESFCRQVCEEAGVIIINVDYRLAPEYTFPIGIWDSYEALLWTFENAEKLGIDKTRVGTGGCSAGGHLSAIMSILARDNPDIPPLKLQLICVGALDQRHYPLDMDASVSEEDAILYPSMKEFQFAPCLPLHRMVWFANLWLGSDPETRKKNANNWMASPILAKDLTNLPFAKFLVADIDPLYSQQIVYEQELKKAGNKTDIKVYKGMAHQFPIMDGELEAAKEFVRDCINTIKEAYA